MPDVRPRVSASRYFLRITKAVRGTADAKKIARSPPNPARGKNVLSTPMRYAGPIPVA
jgi:hypothetical protein